MKTFAAILGLAMALVLTPALAYDDSGSAEHHHHHHHDDGSSDSKS